MALFSAELPCVLGDVGAFPSLPGARMQVRRSPFWRTTIRGNVAGTEKRASWWTTPRYRYRVSYEFLRQDVNAPNPWEDESELGIIVKYYEDNCGSGDSFTFTDPYTGSDVQVRFAEDSLSVRRIANRYWRCEFDLISVI